MIEKDPTIEAKTGRARQYAALTVIFDPLEAVKVGFGDEEYDAPVAARVMGFLRADCTTAADGKGWIMRQSPRDRVLADLGSGTMEAILNQRLPDDPVAEAMRGALTDQPGRIVSEIDSAVASPSPDIERLEQLANAVELAGNAAGPVYEKLSALRSTLDRHRAILRDEEQLAGGYFGNEQLLEKLAAWIDFPPETKMARAFYIKGIPGVGKSFLFTKLVQEARNRANPIVLHLDFDRRGLNLIEPEGLAMELSRQPGNEVPESANELSEMRARFSGEQALESSKRGRGGSSISMLDAMAGAVHRADRPVLLLLDTLEVLASYGDTHPERLFKFLDNLLQIGISPIAIIAAGRGNALEALGRKRIEDFHELKGLPRAVATKMLRKLGAPDATIDEILRIAQGNPLILRLAAKLARANGMEAIDLDRVEGKAPEIAGGFLYRAILSRIDDEKLSEIANLGLIMERVNAEVIATVIAPALGMKVGVGESEVMLSELATHHWLVETESDGWVRHRGDVRKIVLKLLYADRPAEVAAVNSSAATYFADIDPPASLYHVLQTLGPEDTTPQIDPALAALFTDGMIDQLPNHAADLLLQARGERSRSGYDSVGEKEAVTSDRKEPVYYSEGIVDKSPPGLHERALRDLHILLEKGDLLEADGIYRNILKDFDDPQTPHGIAILCYLWLGGHWSKAEKLFRQFERNRFEHADWPGAEGLIQLVLLEMRAEFTFDALVIEFEQDEDILRKAQLAYRDAKSLRLTEGALAYALLAQRRATTISGGWREALASSGTGLQDQSQEEMAQSDVAMLRERHAQSVDLGDTQPWEIAASLNPYSAPIETLVTLRRSPKLRDYAGSVSTGFASMAVTPFEVHDSDGLCTRLLSSPEDNVAQLGALGTAADWLSAFTFFNQVANVPLIARRAEAWRRTAAGQWTYGANSPEGWHKLKQSIDRGTQIWLEQLCSAELPSDEAARQLLFWHRPSHPVEDGIQPMGKRASGRLARALRHAHRAARRANGAPELAATRALMTRGMGRSIAVPVAVLATNIYDRTITGRWLNLLIRSGGREVAEALRKE